MTFTEAAIEVLRREGKPLHFRKIAEIAVRESLLDHVGKIPEETMADQLAAHCRLPHADAASSRSSGYLRAHRVGARRGPGRPGGAHRASP